MSGTRQATETTMSSVRNAVGREGATPFSPGESPWSGGGHSDTTWIDRALDFWREHRMHPVVETVTAWFVAAFCLTYYGYVYLSSSSGRILGRKARQRPFRVPLMTEVRRRRMNEGDQIKEANDLCTLIARSLGGTTNSILEGDRDELIVKIRSHATLRRHISRFAMLMTSLQAETDGGSSSMPPQTLQLYRLLDSIWLALLQLPAIDHSSNNGRKKNDRKKNDEKTNDMKKDAAGFEISLILPAYKECGASVAHTLRCAWNHCAQPDAVQVIVVDAGQCADLDLHLQSLRNEIESTLVSKQSGKKCFWGDLKLVEYRGTGGRGACQNFGSHHATGRLLTFLHSDTLVPINWDAKVKTALRSTKKDKFTVHACAFSYGHNLSKDGLDGMPYPWGIRSVLFLANLRARLFQLPYGDHVLSFPAAYFFYVGGFPDQTIMEDYEIMDLFRQRAKVLREGLRIIPPPTAQCSVRRWQKFGVVYVTLVNALIVNRYAYQGWTADDVFEYYYRRPFENRKQI